MRGFCLNFHELSAMFDGQPLALSTSTSGTLLLLAAGVFVGLWLKYAAFPREAQRMEWAWSRPRQLTTRNASETPRTLGVLLSHALAILGAWSALTMLNPSQATAPMLGLAVAWVGGTGVVKALAARWSFPDLDLRASAAELHRHTLSLGALVIGSWGLVVALQPTLREDEVRALGTVLAVGAVLFFGAVRAWQALNGGNRKSMRGIVYLCTLEWGNAVLWTYVSAASFFEGH